MGLTGSFSIAGDSEAGGHFAQALDGLDPHRMSGRHAPDGGRPGGPPPARAKAPADEDGNVIMDVGREIQAHIPGQVEIYKENHLPNN